MRQILFLLFLCSFTFAQTGLTVEAYDEQFYNNQQMTLRLRVNNSSSETFSNVTLKYYIPYDASRTLQVNPYYVPSATVSQDVVGEQIEISIEIPTLAPGFFPNESGMSIGLNYTDWQNFDKTASSSYPNSNSFVVAENIAIITAGGETDPELGGETDPELGGETDPELGGETDPELGGETDPELGGETDPVIENPIPGIYAISTLLFRENVNCAKSNGDYCDLASAGIQANIHYPLIVGSGNNVGAIHTPATIYFQYGQGGTHVHGNINLYGENASVSSHSTPYWYLIGSEVVHHIPSNFNELFPTVIDIFGDQSDFEAIEVRKNETLTLDPSIDYSSIKVADGGKLIIPPGEIYIDNLQTDPNAIVEFSNPGQPTYLHIDGEFIWRATLNHSEEDLVNIARSFEVLFSTYEREYNFDRTFAGRIVAPYSRVNVDNRNYSGTFYGSILAFNIEVRNNATIKVVPYTNNH